MLWTASDGDASFLAHGFHCLPFNRSVTGGTFSFKYIVSLKSYCIKINANIKLM